MGTKYEQPTTKNYSSSCGADGGLMGSVTDRKGRRLVLWPRTWRGADVDSVTIGGVRDALLVFTAPSRLASLAWRGVSGILSELEPLVEDAGEPWNLRRTRVEPTNCRRGATKIKVGDHDSGCAGVDANAGTVRFHRERVHLGRRLWLHLRIELLRLDVDCGASLGWRLLSLVLGQLHEWQGRQRRVTQWLHQLLALNLHARA